MDDSLRRKKAPTGLREDKVHDDRIVSMIKKNH